MSVSSDLNKEENIFTIRIKGDFDFLLLNEFRSAYNDIDLSTASIVVDMRDTSTIDSSALGMLLNMQRTLEKDDLEITICHCNSVVEKILSITHFKKKFTIK